MRLTTHQKKKKESFTKFMASSYDLITEDGMV